MAFFLHLQFLWFWQHGLTPQYAHAPCSSQANFLNSSFYTGLLSCWEDYRQPLNQLLQSVLCRHCATKLIFSVLGHTSPTVKPLWIWTIKMYFLHAGWKMHKIYSWALYTPRCSVTQQSHGGAQSSPQPSPASSHTANDPLPFWILNQGLLKLQMLLK